MVSESNGGPEGGLHDQHRTGRQRCPRPRQGAHGQEAAQRADAQRGRARAAPVRGVRPEERRGRGDELRRQRHGADLLAREAEPAQVRREISEDRSDVSVMEEVDAAEPASHSGSSVQRSGNCALLASAVVSLTLVSAISKVKTPATAYPCVWAWSMMLAASLSDLWKTCISTSTTNSIGV